MNAEGRIYYPGTSPLEAPPQQPAHEEATSPETTRARQVLNKFTSLLEAGRSKFRETADRVVANVKGETMPEDVEDYQHTWSDVGKAAAAGTVGIVLMWTGTKIGVELPRWVIQKYYTKKEQGEILEVMDSVEGLHERAKALEARINESKRLTPRQKAELIKEVNHALHEKKEHAREEIKELLEESIQTRVKGAIVVAEALNTILITTGVNALRTFSYGAVAAYERYEDVSEGIESGKRTESFAKEYFINGFKETFHNLRGGDAKTRIGKAMNIVKASSTVFRSFAVASLGANEVFGEVGIRSTIATSLQSLEEKGALKAAADHFDANFQHFAHFVHGGVETVASLVSPAHAEDTPTMSREIAPTISAAAAVMMEKGVVEPGGVETAAEYSEAQVELGTPQLGDGFVTVLTRQIEQDPGRFGFRGNVENSADVEAFAHDYAIESARHAGIIRPGGESWLTSEAVGRVSAMGSVDNGRGTVTLLDRTTMEELSLEEARARGFVMERGMVPGEVPTRQEAMDAEVRRMLDGEDPTPTAKLGPIDRRADGLGPDGSLAIRHGADGRPDAIVIDPARLSRDTRSGADAVIGLQPDHQDSVSQTLAHAENVRAREAMESAERLAVLSGVQTRLSETGAASEHVDAFQHAVDAETHAVAGGHAVEHGPGPLSVVGEVTMMALIANEAGEFGELVKLPELIVAKFVYDAAGRPVVNVDALMAHAGKRAKEAGHGLLAKDWRRKISAECDGVAAVMRERAQAVYVFNLALKELESKGASDTVEAHFLRESLRRELANLALFVDGDNPVVQEAMHRAGIEETSPEAARILRAQLHAPSVEISAEDWTAGLRMNALRFPAGEIRFKYDARTRSVTHCTIEGGSVSDEEVQAVLRSFGVTPQMVALVESRSGAFSETARAEIQSVAENVRRLTRQERILASMKEDRLDGTPEHAYLAQETEAMRQYLRDRIEALIAAG